MWWEVVWLGAGGVVSGDVGVGRKVRRLQLLLFFFGRRHLFNLLCAVTVL